MDEKPSTRGEMRYKYILIVAIIFLIPLITGDISAKENKSNVQQKQELRKMRDKALRDLYWNHPKSKQAIAKAAGYGVFDLFGLHIFVAGTSKGKGIVVSNTTKKETFMKMRRIGAGPGMSVKDFRWIFAFETKDALNNFINNGWEMGADASAVAKNRMKGGAFEGAISVAPGVWLYQLTEKGLSLEAVISGTKFWKDDELNR